MKRAANNSQGKNMKNKNAFRLFFYMQIILLVNNTAAQTTYSRSIKITEVCNNFKEPLAMFTYKASSENQKVIGVGKNLIENQEVSFTGESCTVIDKNNWNCANAYASEGNAYVKDTLADLGYKNCHYKKKLFGGWEIINVEKNKLTKHTKYEVGYRVAFFIKANFAAEIFKKTNCKENIIKANSAFNKKEHVYEALNYLRIKFKDNSDVQKLIESDKLSKDLDAISDQVKKELNAEIGSTNPSLNTCGYINGRIDRQINNAKKEIDLIQDE